jgi:flavin reductase (DIM6/NTAB) family NADH-FMN oxidoreductase RutF
MSTTFTTIASDAVKERLGRAIGRIASGVYIITLARESHLDGMLTTFLTQSAFEPPMVVFAVKKERPILQQLSETTNFAVNVLSKKNMDIFKNFAKPYTPELNRFENLTFEADNYGNPFFTESVAYMSCVVRKHIEAGDHFLIVGEILAGDILQVDNEPMIHLRSNGFNY